MFKAGTYEGKFFKKNVTKTFVANVSKYTFKYSLTNFLSIIDVISQQLKTEHKPSHMEGELGANQLT